MGRNLIQAFLAFSCVVRKTPYFSIFMNTTGTLVQQALHTSGVGRSWLLQKGGRAGPGDCSHPDERVHLSPDGCRITKALEGPVSRHASFTEHGELLIICIDLIFWGLC